MKKAVIVIFLIAISLGLYAQVSKPDWLKSGFVDPPREAKPLVWWDWVKGNVTKEGILADVFESWPVSPEIAVAVSDQPGGPYKRLKVALPGRGTKFWYDSATSNPAVHFVNGKYYLYYTGNYGDGKIASPQLNWTHRNHQRIGVAVAQIILMARGNVLINRS